MRIRWRGVARAAAIVLVVLLAVRLVPSLLRAPEPPPLGRDVGLPRAEPTQKPGRVARKKRPSPAHHRRAVPEAPTAMPPLTPTKSTGPHRRAVPDAPASTANLSTRMRHRRREPRPRPDHSARRRPGKDDAPTLDPSEPAESAPSPIPEYAPPPAPEPSPAPLPEPPPAPESVPGDGSEEFAPH